MKNRLLLVIIGLTLCLPAFSQKVEETFYSDKYPDRAHFDSLYYLFPEFTPATIAFKDNSTARAQINIDTFLQIINFIGDRHDTLLVQNERDIECLITNNRYFKKIKNCYVEIVDPSSDISLGIKRTLAYQEEKTSDSYGETPKTSASEQYNPRVIGLHDYSLPVRRLSPYYYTTTYFIVKDYSMYYPSKKAFTKLFPKKKAAITDLLEKEKLDLDKVEDVRFLLEFCLNPK